ncbi:hypothetical protein [Acinetobacter nosocomialis]|uniref:hypothetical protein n=1 Tax=Acinetobacter nosocomialis TaxID=106654 RepID=UPI0012504338|nr:hypothetical protein [Acinetobacter nosocomialis]
MDNYKIKVKDESDAEESRDLFKQLGYKPDNSTFDTYVTWIAVFADGSGSFYGSDIHLDECKELTLPQLRDLVVLKRNDVKDANYKLFISPSQGYLSLYKASDDVFYAYASKSKCWDKSRSVTINTENLEAISKEKDQGLISGAEALRALADGLDVQQWNGSIWWDVEGNYQIDVFRCGKYKFRLKPQTIKLVLEIPAPYKAKIGGRDDTSFVLNVGRHQYLYQNEDDYTKARNALEAVFDAALGGNNS